MYLIVDFNGRDSSNLNPFFPLLRIQNTEFTVNNHVATVLSVALIILFPAASKEYAEDMALVFAF